MVGVASEPRVEAEVAKLLRKWPLTEKEEIRLFFLQLEDDTEDAPWMVMGSLQWDATAELYVSLHEHAERHEPTWYVGAMCPILFTGPETQKRQQLAPDLFVAFVERHPRDSFDADVEGFPPFVLEVVSPSSAFRDHYEKHDAYELMGVREYALFYPSVKRPSRLEGFRRAEKGRFERWPLDEQGRLWSELLGVYLVAQERSVRAATRDGTLIPTLHEEAVARQEAEAARHEAEAARQEAETENERLRRQIEELRRQINE